MSTTRSVLNGAAIFLFGTMLAAKILVLTYFVVWYSTDEWGQLPDAPNVVELLVSYVLLYLGNFIYCIPAAFTGAAAGALVKHLRRLPFITITMLIGAAISWFLCLFMQKYDLNLGKNFGFVAPILSLPSSAFFAWFLHRLIGQPQIQPKISDPQ